MNIEDKHSLEHDFSNSITVIKSMAKSAIAFTKKIPACETNNIKQKQLEIFYVSMEKIIIEACNIEELFKLAIKNNMK